MKVLLITVKYINYFECNIYKGCLSNKENNTEEIYPSAPFLSE